jgi:hypothetical protein
MAASDPTAVPEGVPEERVDALYGVPLEEFTAARDALAKKLKGDGLGEQAGWVKGLRKPSAAAWVVNQLARTQRREAKGLIESGERLRAAHERLLGGAGKGDEVRGAGADEGKAVRALLARAEGLLDAGGAAPSRATLDRVAETLQAVALEHEARAAFAAGRLTRERRAAGLDPFGGDVEGGTDAPEEPERAKPSRQRSARRSPKGKGPDRAAEKRRQEKASAREAVKDAKAEQRDRRRDVVGAERDLERARREAESAQRRLEKATAELERAREEEGEAAARVAEAQAALEHLS